MPSSLLSSAYIIGVGITPVGKLNRSPYDLMFEALNKALNDANNTGGNSCISMSDIDSIVSMPCFGDFRAMTAHHFATQYELFSDENRRKRVLHVKTIDCGGATPIAALVEAKDSIRCGRFDCVAIVCADIIASIPIETMLKQYATAIGYEELKKKQNEIDQKPIIPYLYSEVTEWHMKTYGTRREQFAMAAALMHHQGRCNNYQTSSEKNNNIETVESILSSKPVTPYLTQKECARRSDTGVAILVVSDAFIQQRTLLKQRAVEIIGSGLGSGPFYTTDRQPMDKNRFSLAFAAKSALAEAKLNVNQIDWYGLYDCFPVCFIKAMEDIGLCDEGKGGKLMQLLYEKLTSIQQNRPFNINQVSIDHRSKHLFTKKVIPINTHGGLMGLSAPGDVPAAITVVEAVRQIRNEAFEPMQLPNVNTAFIYGNGGIFSASAVIILQSASKSKSSMTSKL
jgi:acetyl-CoA acetyltransferase